MAIKIIKDGVKNSTLPARIAVASSHTKTKTYATPK